MIAGPTPLTFRRYAAADEAAVAVLWTRINRELAPQGMEALFERYIETIIDGELKHLPELFSPARRNAFWVVDNGGGIVGCFGIESRGTDDTELRRMYLDKAWRGGGHARRMLEHAENAARAMGFKRLILSTAEIQREAVGFYRKSGFAHVRTETAEAMNPKQAGGGLVRLHFEKPL